MKTTTKLLVVFMFAISFSISSTFACINVDYSQIKEGDPVPNNACPQAEDTMVGNDRDEHGCIGSAGYSWSETKNKCVRAWEEKAKTYSTKEAFEKAEGKTCSSATDGCNTFFVVNGKIGGGTLMYCEDIYGENGQEKWSCIDNEKELSDYAQLEVTKVTQGKDGKSLELKNDSGDKYTVTISIVNLGDKYIDLNVGDKVKIAGDYLESNPTQIVNITDLEKQETSKLSENDANYLTYLSKNIDFNLKTKVDSAISKYETKLKKLNNPEEANQKIINKVESYIVKLLDKYPQDIALPEKVSVVYDILEYLKLSLMNIDYGNTKTLEVLGVFGEMDGDSVELITIDKNGKYNVGEKYSTIISIPNLGDNYVSLKMGDRVQITGEFTDNRIYSITSLKVLENSAKTDCEQTGGKWTPQGKAQIPACLTTYTDGGKTCTSSKDCEGNCIKTYPNKSATCEKNNSKFGCKTTVEKFNAGKGILCID